VSVLLVLVLFFRRVGLGFIVVVGLDLVQIDLQRADSRLEFIQLLENVPLLKTRQTDIANALGMQQLIDELVDVNELILGALVHALHLAIVDVQRLQVLVNVLSRARESHVECAESANVLEVLVTDELDYDVFLWLDLKHLQDEAEKRRWLHVAAVDSPY